jgi:hypothetical protein
VSMHFRGQKSRFRAKHSQKQALWGWILQFPSLEGRKGSASWEGSGGGGMPGAGGRHFAGLASSFATTDAQRMRRDAAPRAGRSWTVADDAHLPRPQSSHARRLGGAPIFLVFPGARRAEGARKARGRFGRPRPRQGHREGDRAGILPASRRPSGGGRTHWTP